jgi:hypothetical protein
LLFAFLLQHQHRPSPTPSITMSRLLTPLSTCVRVVARSSAITPPLQRPHAQQVRHLFNLPPNTMSFLNKMSKELLGEMSSKQFVGEAGGGLVTVKITGIRMCAPTTPATTTKLMLLSIQR